jgi:hypothetical protein
MNSSHMLAVAIRINHWRKIGKAGPACGKTRVQPRSQRWVGTPALSCLAALSVTSSESTQVCGKNFWIPGNQEVSWELGNGAIPGVQRGSAQGVSEVMPRKQPSITCMGTRGIVARQVEEHR